VLKGGSGRLLEERIREESLQRLEGEVENVGFEYSSLSIIKGEKEI